LSFVSKKYIIEIYIKEAMMATSIARKKRLQPPKTRDSKGSVAQRTGKVSQWGNSLGVRIPQEAVEQLHLKDGESVHFEFAQDTITIRRASPRRKYTEAQLLKGITPAVCGPDLIANPTGREIV
jgi:antitoxin MazE